MDSTKITAGNRHRHYDMIVAKAANMDLVVFYKDSGKWIELNSDEMPDIVTTEYFLCLPQHKEACLHWLNGGEVEFEYDSKWHSCSYWSMEWYETSGFICEDNKLRIKPKKEKRWIICSPKHGDVNEVLFDYKPEMNSFGKHCQLIEIEVEV